MRAIVKWFLLLLAVLYLVDLAYYNASIITYQLTFAVPVPVLWPPRQFPYNPPPMSLGMVLVGMLVAGAMVTGLAAIVRLAVLRRDLYKARRRVADLEEEVVSYRGRAARESERPEGGEPAIPKR